MTFKAEIRASLGWNWLDGAADNARLDYVRQLLEGNVAGQAEAVWHAAGQTLLDGASLTLDLTALTRTVLGDLNTLMLLTVRALLIVSSGDSVGKLVLGGAAADAWWGPFAAEGQQLVIPPGGPLLLAHPGDGWPVDDTHKSLKLAALDGDVTYSIAIVGTTTAAGSGE